MSLRKKSKKDVPSTVAGTSGASTQSRNVAEIIENAPSFQEEQSISSGKSKFVTDFKIWVKYGDSQPARILFEGEIVHDLKEVVKKTLVPKLDNMALNRITIRRHGEEDDLRPGLVVDRSFINDDETPLQVIVNAPTTLNEDLREIVKSAVREEFSQQKPDEIQASNILETKARKIIEHYGLNHFIIAEEDFQPIEPMQCQPFLWDMENDEAHQMSEVEEWFKNALNLPKGFHVKDIHTRNYQRHLQTANIVLTGGTDISVGPSATSCVWIKVKKSKENFKIGQAISELLILDNVYAPRPMSVLTDCNDNWIIFFFFGTENKEHHYLASSTIYNRSIALAIIRQFVLNEGRNYLELLGKSITYQTNLSEPLKKRVKFLPEEDNERMAMI
ncbi:4965_t:CDS:2 [Gigaspora rosea]|nr:4965_t:CDS:2 [Gigaspora rosea]